MTKEQKSSKIMLIKVVFLDLLKRFTLFFYSELSSDNWEPVSFVNLLSLLAGEEKSW
jgi:hypothetical protein